MCRAQCKFIFSPKELCFVFHFFWAKLKTRTVSFLAKCSTKSIFLQIMINVYEKCWTRMEAAAQLSLHFSGGKCVTWEKTENTDSTQPILIKFSPKWSIALPSSCNRWPWNIDRSQNLQILLSLKRKYSLKSFPTSNLAKQTNKIEWDENSAPSRPPIVVFDSINFAPFFHLFQVDWKTKIGTELLDYSTFSKVFYRLR